MFKLLKKTLILSEFILNVAGKKMWFWSNYMLIGFTSLFWEDPNTCSLLPWMCFSCSLAHSCSWESVKERRDWARRALNTNNFQHGLVQKIAWINWRNICKREAFLLWMYHNKAGYSGTCVKGPERSEKERKSSSLWSEKRKKISAMLFETSQAKDII